MQHKAVFDPEPADLRARRAFRSLGLPASSLTLVAVKVADSRVEPLASGLRGQGWHVVEVDARTARGPGDGMGEGAMVSRALDDILTEQAMGEINLLALDAIGADKRVVAGLALSDKRPWALVVESMPVGSSASTHHEWEPAITAKGYRYVAFDGANRWYVADEHPELVEAIAPASGQQHGQDDDDAHGGTYAERRRARRPQARRAWQRELILRDVRGEVPKEEYERQIDELRTALIAFEGSKAHKLAKKADRKAKGAIFRAKSATAKLPGPVQKSLVRKRHLKHVTVNMGHLTPGALLGQEAPHTLTWITPDGLPPAPEHGVSVTEFTKDDARGARAWLDSGPYDTDDLLARRIDNHDDELGRVQAALRLRLRLAERPDSPHWAGGNRIMFDARSLQSAAFGNRGIGRFAKAALEGLREAISDDRITLLVDHGLEELPQDLAGACQQVTRIDVREVPAFSVLIEPSPMTAPAGPLVPLLHSNARRIAIVFDFIPMHWPTLYLGNVAARIEYAAALDALKLYDDFVCISHMVKAELAGLLGKPLTGPDAIEAVVAWPKDVLPKGENTSPAKGSGPMVVMTGDDIRKNTFGGLAGIAAATAGAPERDVVVIGMAGQGTRVHHWSIAAAMRPGEARTVERISDEEMHALLANASLVVVPSFDEGLSLPVIEAVRAGAPVVASDIPSHRELIGAGSYLADPKSPGSLAKAINAHEGKAATQQRQMGRLLAHQHAPLETVIGKKAREFARPASVDVPVAQGYSGGRRLKVALAGPWSPQRTGVADFTVSTITELARIADVTLYATAGANAAASLPPDVRIEHRPFDELVEHGHDCDVLVAILGNSHFHLPMLRLLEEQDAVVITHDTRLVELYLSLRDRGGVENVMLRGTGRKRLDPSLDEQIDDMRLLESTAYWEVARRAKMLIAHTPTAAPRMADETGRPVHLLPFANYRSPDAATITDQMRQAARERLGFDDQASAGTIHLASFGFIDTRTKMTDVVLESAAWLSQWGHRVALHLVGSATPGVHDELMARAEEAGLADFEITGFVDDDTFRDYVLAVDLGVQLRVSPLLGVSGPLSDMAAYGTPAVASRGLAADVDAPSFVDRLPDDVSPVMVAEAIEYRMANPIPAHEREVIRRDYLDRKSPQRYAEELLALLTEHALGDRAAR